MSHPGNGPDLNPSGQQPGQPGQPYPPFEQQPAQAYPPFEQQPGQPAGAWTPPGGAPVAGEPQKKSGLKKVLPIVGGVAVAGIVGFGGIGNLLGLGDPGVGDCVKSTGSSDFETVDCGSDEAEAEVVGIDEEEVSYDDILDGAEVCMDHPTADSILWVGDQDSMPGTVYCAQSL